VRVELQTPSPLTVDGDRELLFRALENVVRNAVRFAPNGSVVQLSAQRREQQVVIRVSDQGPGVPDELLKRIFEPFFRVGKARDRDSGGYGIGLAITARVAALHGGSVQASNAPAGGLQVELALPLRQGPARAASALPAPSAPLGAIAAPAANRL